MRAGVRPAASDREADARNGPGDRHEPPASELPTLGRYRLERCLKPGGPVTVWRASLPGSSVYALKILRFDVPNAHAALGHLRREFELASSVDHAHICRAREWIESDNANAIVFEYLDGGDLVSLAGAPVSQWVKPVRDLCRALGYLHGLGLVHRDVKARNVRIAGDGAMLIDLGSCREIGAPWSDAGTSAEHRPPAWRGSRQSTGDDVYALAVLLHELIWGRLPGQAPATVAESAAAGAGLDAASRPAFTQLKTLVLETLAQRPDRCEWGLDEFGAVVELLIRTECAKT